MSLVVASKRCIVRTDLSESQYHDVGCGLRRHRQHCFTFQFVREPRPIPYPPFSFKITSCGSLSSGRVDSNIQCFANVASRYTQHLLSSDLFLPLSKNVAINEGLVLPRPQEENGPTSRTKTTKVDSKLTTCSTKRFLPTNLPVSYMMGFLNGADVALLTISDRLHAPGSRNCFVKLQPWHLTRARSALRHLLGRHPQDHLLLLRQFHRLPIQVYQLHTSRPSPS